MAEVVLRVISEGATESAAGIAGIAKQYEKVGQASEDATKTQKKAFSDTEQASKKTTNILKDGYNQVGQTIVGAFAAQAIIGAIKSFATESIKAFREAEVNAKKLEFAVKNIAGEGDSALGKLLQQSAELQDKGIFSDDDIQRAQTMLLQLGLNSKQVEDLTPKILDLASAQGTDLASATDKIISAVNGQTRGLKEAGIAFEDTGSKTENLAVLSDKLAKFQGATADALNTSAGAAQHLENKIGDLEEKVGEFLDGQLKGLKGDLIDIVNIFSSFDISSSENIVNSINGLGKSLIQYSTLGLVTFENTTRDLLEKQNAIIANQGGTFEDLFNAVRDFNKIVKNDNSLASQDELKRLADEAEKKKELNAKNAESELKRREFITDKLIQQQEEGEKRQLDKIKKADDERIKQAEARTDRLIQQQEEGEKRQLEIVEQAAEIRKNLLSTFGKSDLEIKIQQLKSERDEILKNTLLTEQERFAINKDTETKITALKQAQLNAQLQGLSQQFANISLLEQAFGAETKAGASAQALISTFLSAQNSFAFGAKLGGPILGAIFASIATAAGLANVAKINGVEFAEGGYTGDGGKYDEAGVVHKGEFVMTKEKTAKHRALFEAIHNDQQLGFADLSSLLKGTGVSLNPDVPASILKQYNVSDQKEALYKSDADKRLASIENELKKWRHESNSKEQRTQNPDGSSVTKKGNVTRIIRRKKI